MGGNSDEAPSGALKFEVARIEALAPRREGAGGGIPSRASYGFGECC